MGYSTKIQVIQRQNNSKQFYMMIPAQTAEALEFEKGEEVEWIIESKEILVIKRKTQKKISKAYKSTQKAHSLLPAHERRAGKVQKEVKKRK